MSSTGRPSRRPTLEESEELDQLIREVAIAEFLEHGFSGTTMGAVARSAGVTRQTLYARYPDKRTLFSDVTRWALLHTEAEDAPLPIDDDLAGSLSTIARAALARAVDPEVVRLSALVMAESPRFPELVPKAHHLTRHPQVDSVVEVLRRHAAAGVVSVDDVELAAEQFLTVVASHPARLAAFGLRRSAADEERYLRHAVQLFIDGVRTRVPNEPPKRATAATSPTNPTNPTVTARPQ